MPLQSNYTSNDTPRFRKLSDDQTERLHHASLEILDRTGIVLYEPEAVELLGRKGLKAEEADEGRGARVRIPPGPGRVGAERRTEARRYLQPQRPPRHAARTATTSSTAPALTAPM